MDAHLLEAMKSPDSAAGTNVADTVAKMAARGDLVMVRFPEVHGEKSAELMPSPRADKNALVAAGFNVS